jgi:hypothetical protein
MLQPVSAYAKSEAVNIKEGAWRIAILMTIPNASGPSTGPAQFDRCMDPKNLEGLLVMPPNAPCVLLKSRLKKDSLTWEMSCNQGGFSTSASGRILFAGTRLEGEINTVAKGPQTINIKTNIEGRYIGQCVSPGNVSPGKQNPAAPSKLQKFKE